MSLKARRTGAAIAPMPGGVHLAICIGAMDLGTQPSHFDEEEIPTLMLAWETPNVRAKSTQDGATAMPRYATREYRSSLHKKAKLREHLEAWRGQTFTSKEVQGFDFKRLIGVGCQIQVMQHTSEAGNVYAQVANIQPWPHEIPRPVKTEHPHWYFSFDENQAGTVPVIPKEIPDWIAEKIRQSPEWEQLTAQAHPPAPKPQQAELGAPEQGDGEPPQADDLPF